jgi:hypothetical protein
MELVLPKGVDHSRTRLVFGIDVTLEELGNYYDRHWQDYYSSPEVAFAKEAAAVQLLGFRVGYVHLMVNADLPTIVSEEHGTSNVKDDPAVLVALVSIAQINLKVTPLSLRSRNVETWRKYLGDK